MVPADPRPTPGVLRSGIALALVAIALRLVLLAAPGPDVSPDWVFPEEQHRGNIACEVLQGPLLDLQDYHHAPNVGGSLVVGVLAAPFVATLGPNALAVRMPTLLLHGLAVLILFALLDRHVSRRAAWAGGVLFAIAPPGYLLLSVTAWGTHVENNTFVLLALYLFLELVALPHDAPRTRSLGALLGAVAGFGCYFGYSFAAALAALGLLAFVRDRAFFLRRWFGFACAGFVVGFLPWIRYNALHDFAGLSIYNAGIVGSAPQGPSWPEKLGWFFTTYFPRSLYFRPNEQGDLSWAEPVLAGVLLGTFVGVAVRWRRELLAAARRFVAVRAEPPRIGIELACVAYFLCFTVAMLAARPVQTGITTAIAHDGRYAAPLLPFLCLAFGAAFEPVAAAGRIARRIAVAGVTAIALLLGVAFAGLLDADAAPGSAAQAGASDEELARWIVWTYKSDVERLARLVDGLERRRPEDVRAGTLFVMGEILKSRLMAIPADDPRRGAFRESCRTSLAFLRAKVPPEYRMYFEEPWPGEKLYSWHQRREFHRVYEERRRAAASSSDDDAER
jgi:hypothetical protein